MPGKEEIVTQGIPHEPEQDKEQLARDLVQALRKPQQESGDDQPHGHNEKTLLVPLLFLFHQAQLVGVVLVDGRFNGLSLLLRQAVLDNVQHDGRVGGKHFGARFKIVREIRVRRLVMLGAEGVDDIVVGGNPAGECRDAVIDEIPVQQLIHLPLPGLEKIDDFLFAHIVNGSNHSVGKVKPVFTTPSP